MDDTDAPDITSLPNGVVFYWLTLQLTEGNPAIKMRTNTTELAETIGASGLSEQARRDLIANLYSFDPPRPPAPPGARACGLCGGECPEEEAIAVSPSLATAAICPACGRAEAKDLASKITASAGTNVAAALDLAAIIAAGAFG